MMQVDVAVMGGGMVGLSAALALSQKGLSVAVVEKQSQQQLRLDLQSADSQEYDLRVSAISPASQQFLGRLGIWEKAARQRSCDYQRMLVWHQQGRSQMEFDCGELALPDLGCIMENRILQQVMIDALLHSANVTLLFGQRVADLNQGDSSVELTTDQGEMIRANLLISADGRNSMIHSLYNVPLWRGDYQQQAIVANLSTEKPHQNTAWQRFLTTGPLAFLPLSNGQSSIVWSVDTEKASQLMSLPDEEFFCAVGEAFEYRLGAVVAGSARAAFPLVWQQALQWLFGRVILIGDAAHAVHPLAGQGVNLGFADVELLADLIPCADSVSDQRILRQFERQRKAETLLATQLFSSLKWVYGLDSGVAGKLRDFGMSLVQNTSLVRRKVIEVAVSNRL